MTQPDTLHPDATPADDSQASGAAAPAEPDALWSYVPQSAATAQIIADRARRAGRPVPPAAARWLEPADPEPAADPEPPAAAPEPAADPEPPAECAWLHDVATPAALAGGPVFTRALRVRFLDHLAFSGNVRAAAARVGISRETAYRSRRQDPALAALWDAALVHARHFAEAELATRALDGVEVAVRYRGEVVGHEMRHDPRLLLAHLARLDRRVESDPEARARAARFDELLAAYAGHPEPGGFADAGEEARSLRAPDQPADLPPSREEYAAWCRGQMLEAIAAADGEGAEHAEDEPEAEELTPEERERRDAVESEALAEATEDGEAEWDDWHDGAHALVAAIAGGAAAPADTPVEVKSARPAGARRRRREARGPCHMCQDGGRAPAGRYGISTGLNPAITSRDPTSKASSTALSRRRFAR